MSAKLKYSRAVKRRARAYMDFINSKTEPLQETSRDMTALVEHPALLQSDDDEPMEDTSYGLEDEDTYFTGFGPSDHETSTAEADCLQPQQSGRATPNLFGIAAMYQSQVAPPSALSKRDTGGCVAPDLIGTPGPCIEQDLPRDLLQFSRSTTPPRDPKDYVDPHLFANSRYMSENAPRRTTTPEGDPPECESYPGHCSSNVRHFRQIHHMDPELEQHTGVRIPSRNTRVPMFDSDYPSNSSYGLACHSTSGPSWRLSGASDIQSSIISPFELRHDESSSGLFGRLGSAFQAWSTFAQLGQASANSNGRHGSGSIDVQIPASTWLNPIHLLSSRLWNGNGRETDTKSSSGDDALYDVGLNSNNPSNDSDDGDWVAVARRIEDEGAVIFARRLFTFMDRWGSPRAELFGLVMQSAGTRRVMNAVTGRRQTGPLRMEQNEALEGQQTEAGEEDDEVEDGWVEVPEVEER